MKYSDNLPKIADFLFEVGQLTKTPRSGFFFLGSGEQSVAEHINRACYIGFTLAQMSGDVDTGKVVMLCLFHDITESRISDLNYVHQKYTERKEDEAESDLIQSIPFGPSVSDILNEYHARQSKESRLAKDADNIEFLLSLVEQSDIGNERAKEWMPSVMGRFITEEGKTLAEEIIKTPSDRWWFGDRNDIWWVNRNK